MEARTTLHGSRISTAVVVTFVAALLAAFLLGGAGGYLIRALSAPVSSRITTPLTVPQPKTAQPKAVIPDWAFLRQPQPTMPQQTLDPSGYVIHSSQGADRRDE